jgi:2Fe-2S ferredoxin
MLDCVIDRLPNSRLSCQIRVSDDIDGISVRVPESQI